MAEAAREGGQGELRQIYLPGIYVGRRKEDRVGWGQDLHEGPGGKG